MDWQPIETAPKDGTFEVLQAQWLDWLQVAMKAVADRGGDFTVTFAGDADMLVVSIKPAAAPPMTEAS